MVQKTNTMIKDRVSDGVFVTDKGRELHYVNSRLYNTGERSELEALIVGELYDVFNGKYDVDTYEE